MGMFTHNLHNRMFRKVTKHLMTLRLIVLFAFILVSCKEEKNRFFFLRTGKYGLDSSYFELTKNTLDSVHYLNYKFSETYTIHFKFSLKNKLHASSKGLEFRYAYGQFNQEESAIIFQSDTAVYLLGNKYYVCKYLYDETNSFDEEAYYYWSPSIGIVIIKSLNWDIKNILQSENSNVNDTLTQLINSIQRL